MLTTIPASTRRVIWFGVTVSAATVVKQVRQTSTGSNQSEQISLVHRADEGRIMRALARHGQMRPLDVEAKKARYTFGRSFGTGGHGRGVNLSGIGDQRRQAGRRAKLREGAADGLDRLQSGIQVEQRTATAIDLQIDEAGTEYPARQCDLLSIRRGSFGDDCLDLAVTDDQRGLLPPARTVKDAGAGIDGMAHVVSVIFLRCGGLSGSKPRWRDNISTNP